MAIFVISGSESTKAEVFFVCFIFSQIFDLTMIFFRRLFWGEDINQNAVLQSKTKQLVKEISEKIVQYFIKAPKFA